LEFDTVEGNDSSVPAFHLLTNIPKPSGKGFQSKTNVANDEMFLYFAGGYSGLSQLRIYQV